MKLNYNANQVKENIKSIIVQVLGSLAEDLKSGVYRAGAWEHTAYQVERRWAKGASVLSVPRLSPSAAQNWDGEKGPGVAAMAYVPPNVPCSPKRTTCRSNRGTRGCLFCGHVKSNHTTHVVHTRGREGSITLHPTKGISFLGKALPSGLCSSL